MVEQESKININNADGPLLISVLTAQGADANDISVVSDSILDWIDPDDDTRPAGAESDRISARRLRITPRNAPIDNLDELTLVKGVTHDMYVGGDSEGGGTPFPQHQLGFGHAPGQEPNYAFGLRDVFTPFSSGKINVLTANDQVLQLIPSLGTAEVQAIITARDSDPPVRNIPQLLAAAGINPQAAGQVMNYVDVRGSTYEIDATATIGQLSHEFTAIVVRTART